MTLVTIGRFGTSFDADASQWDVDGDQVSASGYINNTDRTLIALARQQIIGLSPPESDEPVVPVTFSSDSSQDGYYRILSSSVPMDAGRYAAKSLPWSVSMVRVPNFQSPDIEILSRGETRGNVSSYDDTDTQATVAVPADYTVGDFPTTTPTSYPTNFGSVAISDDPDYFNRRTIYRVAPTDFYDGACRVEQKIGSTWYPVVGRQVKAAATDIRVNNGLLRIAGYLDGTPASSGIQMESVYASGASWGAVKTFNFRRSGAALVVAGPESVQVVENKPEAVRVRYTYKANTGSAHTMLTVTVRMRRGHRMADITMECPATITWLVRSSVAMVAATGGYQAAADDANSQRHVMAIRHASSLTGSDFDILWTAGSDKTVFGLGVRETGGGSLWGTIADTMHRWFAYVGESQVVQF